MSLTRTTTSETGPFYATGSISFSSLRTNFKRTVSGSIRASELLRNTNLNETDPVVPDCTENRTTVSVSPAQGISSSTNLKLSQFRNSIKYYNLTQGSDTDLNLNIAASGLWNSNLQYNIKKTVTLSGTSGSTNGSAAASLDAAAVYNVLLIITGSILGTGGSSGSKGNKNQSDGSVVANAGNGGNGGNALYINTNSTGTVTVRTSGSSAQVYGGGGGGAGGGWGGNGADGSYITYYSYYVSGGGGSVTNGSSTYYIRCQQACQNVGGEWANNCYKHISEPGWNCGGNTSDWWSAVCYSDDATRVANTTACRYTVTGSTTNPSYGGHGGDGTAGGVGQGYLQTKTNATNAPALGETDGPTARSHSSAGNAGTGGRGANGGDWGQPGDDNSSENGYPGYQSNGTTVYENGGSKGTSGAAGASVSGSGYVIDSLGVDSAYKGSK